MKSSSNMLKSIIPNMDLFGPTSVRSINHKTYCLVITDDFSRFSWVFFLRTKDETSGILKEFINNSRTKTIRCDNGTKFKNKDIIELYTSKRIKREYSNARTSQQNGVVGKKNRTFIEAARTMLANSFLPDTFWAKAVSTACYVLNRPVTLENKANKTAGPKEANNSAGTQDKIDAENSKMEVEHVPEYFVLTLWSFYTLIVKCSKANNGDEKLNEDIGLKTNEESVDQEDQAFLEELKNLKQQAKEVDDAAETLRKTTPVNTVGTTVTTASPSRNDIYEVLNDGIFTSASYDDEGAVADFTNLESTVNIEPQKISQALEDESWVDAMQEELLQFKTQNVWILVDLPFRKKVNGTKWVYRNTKDERGVVVRNKARLEAIRIFLAFASYMGFIVYQMDMKSVFLYDKIDEKVYVSQPLDFIDPKFSKKVYKVVKALYGLHQAPRAWFQVTPKTLHLQAVKRIFRSMYPTNGRKKAKIGLNIKEGNLNKLDDLVGEGADYAVNKERSTNKIKVLNVEAEGVSAAGETLSTATLARLIYRGMILEDDQTLDAYGLQKDHTIYMEVAQNRLFAETETTPPSDTTTGLDRPTRGMPYMSQLMEEMIMIDIICSNGDMLWVRTSVGSKVVEFKDLLAQISRIPANAQSLIYRGKILKDDRSLYSYGLQADHAIHLEPVLNPRFSGGLGLQGLDRPTRGMPDMSQLILTISLMMQSFLSNPKYMKQIIEQNPQLRSMFDSIPQLREMMQNPEVVRRLTSPQLIDQMMSSPLLPELNQQPPFTTGTTLCDSTITTSRDEHMEADVTVNCVHPGIVRTGLTRDREGFVTDFAFLIASKLLKTIPQAAATTCYVATHPELRNVSGKYFADCNEASNSEIGCNLKEAARLWSFSEIMKKMFDTVKYLLGSPGPSGYGSKTTAEQVTDELVDLRSLTVIITGATSGIGAETARVLAKRGARLVIPARNLKVAEEIKARISLEFRDTEIIVMPLDLSSLKSVRRFVTQFEALDLPLNLLINNAGKFAYDHGISEDGVEMTFATNYLGHFLLTKLLLKKMISTAKTTGIQGRIVNVSSGIHTWFSGDLIRSLSQITRDK
nr:short-chain dehydrogenase TIC 32, chloroplastic [Tanacetum cinerariifolium]